MTSNTDIEIAFAWYDSSEWPLWRETCEDGEEFFGREYSQWVELAERAIAEQESLGRVVRKTPIRIEAFLEWTERKKMGTGPRARAAFAAFHSQPEES